MLRKTRGSGCKFDVPGVNANLVSEEVNNFRYDRTLKRKQNVLAFLGCDIRVCQYAKHYSMEISF